MLFPLYQTRSGFLFMNFYFKSAAGQKSELHVMSSHTFRLCTGRGEDFWHRKFWRILIQGCLFYFLFNVKMQFSPLTCCSCQICCNKGLRSHPFSFYGLCFLAEQQIHWEFAEASDWCWLLLKQNCLKLSLLMKNWEEKKKDIQVSFFLWGNYMVGISFYFVCLFVYCFVGFVFFLLLGGLFGFFCQTFFLPNQKPKKIPHQLCIFLYSSINDSPVLQATRAGK